MKAAFPESEIVWRKGMPVSVILTIKDYEKLLKHVEDSEGAALKHARRKPQHYRSLPQCKDTGLPVSAGRRPIKAVEVDRLLAQTR